MNNLVTITRDNCGMSKNYNEGKQFTDGVFYAGYLPLPCIRLRTNWKPVNDGLSIHLIKNTNQYTYDNRIPLSNEKT